MVAGLERCKTAFTYKSAAAIGRELELFFLHHDDVLTFLARQREFQGQIDQVDRNRRAFVAEEMARYDQMIRMAEEEEE